VYSKDLFCTSSAWRPPSAAWLRSSKKTPKRSGEMAVPGAAASASTTVSAGLAGSLIACVLSFVPV
jgi:hypothetical protein